MKCRESTIRAPIFKAEQRTDTYFFNARLGYAIGSFESIAEVSLLSCRMVFGIARFVVGFLVDTDIAYASKSKSRILFCIERLNF